GAGRGSGAKLNASTYLRRGRLTVKMAVAGSAASHAAAVAVGQPRLLRVHLMTAARRLAPDCDLPLPARTHEALRQCCPHYALDCRACQRVQRHAGRVTRAGVAP